MIYVFPWVYFHLTVKILLISFPQNFLEQIPRMHVLVGIYKYFLEKGNLTKFTQCRPVQPTNVKALQYNYILVHVYIYMHGIEVLSSIMTRRTRSRLG
jgi:hypothetical protein